MHMLIARHGQRDIDKDLVSFDSKRRQSAKNGTEMKGVDCNTNDESPSALSGCHSQHLECPATKCIGSLRLHSPFLSKAVFVVMPICLRTRPDDLVYLSIAILANVFTEKAYASRIHKEPCRGIGSKRLEKARAVDDAMVGRGQIQI
jgi:hypothetical protein